ncbi:hypothetical protein HZC27_03065 [Candidatus Roizmanbacteria bacterium]|nr:hypothetical protein [Candidatus Roizmanbacteria bacterium]
MNTNLKPIFIREEIIKAIRAFFYAKNFHEVIVPVLNDAVPLESHLFPFETSWNTVNGDKKRYLSLSPERGLKRMLAAGIGNCFALGKSFRNLENSGSQHLPEFLMLEWYRENADYHQIMNDTEELILYIQKNLETQNLSKKKLLPDWKKISLHSLFKKTGGWDESREVFDQIFVNKIESKFPQEPFFLVDFPTRFSPLCKPQKENPHLAQRFELYINGMEIGNGNTENTDVDSIRKTLKKPVDEVFLKALNEMRGEPFAGMGIGIDRLAMLFSGVKDIKQIEILI